MSLSGGVDSLATRVATEINAVRAELDLQKITVSATAPTSPAVNQLWLDIS